MPRISSSGARGVFMLTRNDRSVAVGHAGLSVALVVELVFPLDPAPNFFALGVLHCGLPSDGAAEQAGLGGGAELWLGAGCGVGGWGVPPPPPPPAPGPASLRAASSAEIAPMAISSLCA